MFRDLLHVVIFGAVAFGVSICILRNFRKPITSKKAGAIGWYLPVFMVAACISGYHAAVIYLRTATDPQQVTMTVSEIEVKDVTAWGYEFEYTVGDKTCVHFKEHPEQEFEFVGKHSWTTGTELNVAVYTFLGKIMAYDLIGEVDS